MHRILHEEIVRPEIMRGNMNGHLKFYERMMLQVPGKKDDIDEETMCIGRPYHRKDFAYSAVSRRVFRLHRNLFPRNLPVQDRDPRSVPGLLSPFVWNDTFSYSAGQHCSFRYSRVPLSASHKPAELCGAACASVFYLPPTIPV